MSKIAIAQKVVKAIGKQTNFDSAELLGAMVDQWGGVGALASDLRRDYLEAKAGSMTRQKIIEMIARLTINVTQQGAANRVSASTMSDEDLLASASQLVELASESDVD